MPENGEKACEGGRTIEVLRPGTEFRECERCGMSVRHDLVDHAFFGFEASCPLKKEQQCLKP